MIATAKKTTVPKTVTVEEPAISLTLTLTPKQAADLCRLAFHVGGDSRTTTRGVFQDIQNALYGAGVEMSPPNVLSFAGTSGLYPGSLTFR